MNFNNPDDIYSSSPLSGDNKSPGGESIGSNDSDNEDEEAAPDSENSSQSSARLDAALRQAATQAGTQKLDLDEEGDLTMDIAEDEVTASFKPWAKKAAAAQDDQENVDPFSPPTSVIDEGEDMSMDITRAVGGIVPQAEAMGSESDDDMTMDLTMPLGSIKSMDSRAAPNRRKSLKRRMSVLDASQGSPAKRPASRRTSLRQRRQSEETVLEDVTMDFTTAIGAITKTSLLESTRRTSMQAAFEDVTMDFTLAVGSIKAKSATAVLDEENEVEDEDLSMEFTKIVGPGIKRLAKPVATPATPTLVSQPIHTPLKSPTPRKSPKEASAILAEVNTAPATLVQTTPKQSPGRVIYPSLDPSTPEFVRQRNFEDIEPSPFVRKTPQSTPLRNGLVSTPKVHLQNEGLLATPEDPVAAPILNRRRSSLSNVQFSPLNAPRNEPALKSTAMLTNSIKLLSTPRKHTLLSPTKRSMTPKKSQTPQKQLTPELENPTRQNSTRRKSTSPKKHVAFGEQRMEDGDDVEPATEGASEVERISLQEFLDMTKIRFMDLSTTKRRHTAAPAIFHDTEVEEKEETLDRYVVAGACTLPEYELYQHACHEMKKYISDGRHFVRTMEGNVMEENPLLFSEYLMAPPDQRIIMDNQFKNLKMNARLEARGEWYTWRDTLLRDLESGLLATMDGFKRDEVKLDHQDQLLDALLPALIEKHELLSLSSQQLQQRHDELNSCDREELEATREKLVDTNAEFEEKRQLLEQLQQELAEKEAHIDAIKERKVEYVEEIKAAERVREECRGWSTSEVSELKGV